MEENNLETSQVIQSPAIRMSIPNGELNDSLITKMSNMQISNDSFGNNMKVSALTLTTDHPLMNLENYLDGVPKFKKEIKDDSLLSIEDESKDIFYSPKRNTSKNNLYFNDFSDGQNLNDISRIEPQHETHTNGFEKNANVNQKHLASISVNSSTPRPGDTVKMDMYREWITPIQIDNVTRSPDVEEYYTGLADWSDAARSAPTFDLPMELSSCCVSQRQEPQPPQSPDGGGSSAGEERSSYHATLDAAAGRAALRHTPRARAAAAATHRRRILLPPETTDSSDSGSVSSLESEEAADEELDPGAEDQLGEGHRTGGSPIPEYSLAEERRDSRAWLAVPPPGRARCDLTVIEPYRRVLSHGGYVSGSAIIVFSACHLPDRARRDYHYVMDNLLLYIMVTLERLVSDDYVLVYLHGCARGRRLPTLHWLRHSYTLVDRRLRKSLKHLYLVHPTFWLKSIVVLCKPFVSSKFFRKLSYVHSLEELMRRVPVEPNAIPDLVREFDAAQ